MAENYNLIFGSNASQTYSWSDADYQTGWETVGDTPPTAQQFNALQNRADKKAQELNNRVIPLEAAIGAYERQPSTGYSSGVAVLATGLNLPFYLECTTAGTTSTGGITIPSSPSAGTTISDGTVVWTIRKIVDSSSTSGYITKDVTNLTYYRKKTDTPAFNTRDEITTSGTWVAPVTGWYKITLKGGGAGGQGGGYGVTVSYNGHGGGEGGTTIVYKYLTAGTSTSVIIGAGGSGGASQSGSGTAGSPGGDGGDTSVTISGLTYTAGGGHCLGGGVGGTGDIYGAPGCVGFSYDHAGNGEAGGAGGGAGGGGIAFTFTGTTRFTGVNGGGGAGGYAHQSASIKHDGYAGGNGYVWFEYWAN